jgi:ubiquinone/menaquinone biosynthesis C-methylase UbiE
VFYQDQILPRIVHWAMRQSSFTEYRQRLVPDADGRVLEIGSGSGLNLPFYSERANQVLGLDSSKTLLSWARKSASPTHAVMWLQASAEAIPLDDASVRAGVGEQPRTLAYDHGKDEKVDLVD